MQRQEGIHFYINIVNFNSIILDEEMKTRKITHAIHALDTFFTSIEKYGKQLFPQSFEVEKITGSRLHLYVVDDIEPAFLVVKTIAAYAYRLARYLNKDISKYELLLDFDIQVGAAFGDFYDFEFKTESFSETTTIGFAANYAAKVQALTGTAYIGISEEIYNTLPYGEKKGYERVENKLIKKYGKSCFYRRLLLNLDSPVEIKSDDLQVAKDYANSKNLSDISYSGVRKSLDFTTINRTQCKTINGIPVFADIRGFTSQFDKDDGNLEEMAKRTQKVLESMYRISTDCGGVHIQFQGDRELSLYHDIPGGSIDGLFQPEKKCFKSAVLAAMRIVDAVKPFHLHVGVGEDYGRLFATKIGARGERDNILLGETVIQADLLEDKKAAEDQIAITEIVYSGLRSEDRNLANQFKRGAGCYIATIGYKQYIQNVAFEQQKRNTKQNKYNGGWGDLL